MTSLCPSCASLELTAADFASLPTGPSDAGRKQTEPRTISYAKANTNCSLCQLTSYALDATRETWETEVLADDAIYYRSRLMPYRFPISSTPFMILDVRTQFPFYGPSYGIQLLPAGPAGAQRPLIGRLLGPSDTSLPRVKGWIMKCSQDHGSFCDHNAPSTLEQVREVFYLIDVERSCIVQGMIGVKYLALSYVWGQVDQPTLLTSNLEQLQRPGAFAAIHASLPRSIQDAIALTKDLGEQYLWIDTFCIVQDDAQFKSQIINRMNLIYQSAYVTIIMATGSDANAGIWGTNANEESDAQPAAFINDDLSLIYTPSHQSLARSTWATRGWTYQEYYFSRRRLIFHDGLIYYHCRKASWRSDVALEHLERVPEQYNLDIGFQASSQVWSPQQAQSDFLQKYASYWRCVGAYKERTLRYESDMLAAFAGVTEHFRCAEALETFWGLPIASFGAALYWQTDRLEKRREGFPTWSWAGWTGELRSKGADNDHLTHSSWIAYFRIGEEQDNTLTFEPISTFSESIRNSIRMDRHDITAEDVAAALTDMISLVERAQDVDYRGAPEFKQSIETMVELSHTRFDTVQTLLARSLDDQLRTQAIFFRTLTATVFVSACAPNGELMVPPTRERWIPTAKIGPTLYAYSTAEPNFRPVGLAWIHNAIIYATALKQSSEVVPDKIFGDLKPGRTSTVTFTADPSIVVDRADNEDTADAVESPTDAHNERSRIIEEMLKQISEESQYPYEAIGGLPDDPQSRKNILRSRTVLKYRIAVISGPVEISSSSRAGIPFGYHMGSRRCLRALVLHDTEIDHPSGLGVVVASRRIGICELEIDSLSLLSDLSLDDIVLV